uniref:Uncharacterized protein n=1 Tax=Megaviridae environmental sample TaxID=1737588 RepID=A0A5J6VK38_9VIRU|nr:MAG: hypothetical protein [Megaviridae environmental sample]
MSTVQNATYKHIWLYLSSYGIIFALLSFLEDIIELEKIKKDYPWMKGTLAIIFGFIFYLIVGLKQLE